MNASGFFWAGFAFVMFIWLCITAGFLLLGAKIVDIPGRSYGRALAITVLNGIILSALSIPLKLAPVFSALLGTVGGLLVTSLLMMPIFKSTYGRSLAAAALAWGFTFVAVGVPAMFAAILLPAIGKATTTAAMVQTLSNGKFIYLSAFAGQMNEAVETKSLEETGFPKVGQYSTSTEYFKHLVESGIMNVSYDFFAAPGIPACKSIHAADFKAENNAWCVVLGLNDAPEGTPFLFTRNFHPEALQAGDGPIELTDEPPFGNKGVVVVLKGGAAFYLKKYQLTNSLFNPAQTPSGTNLVILRP